MNLTQKILIIGGCVAVLAGCRKDDPKPTPDNFISYKINGVYKILVPDATAFDDGTWLLTGGPFNKGEISLFLDTPMYVKSYDFKGELDEAIGDYCDEAGSDFWSDSGTMVINSYNNGHITGTFAFRARTRDSAHRVVRITEGQFSATQDYLSASPDTSNWDLPPVQPIGDDDPCQSHSSDWSNANDSRNLKGPGKHGQFRSRYLQHRSMIFGKPGTTR